MNDFNIRFIVPREGLHGNIFFECKQHIITDLENADERPQSMGSKIGKNRQNRRFNPEKRGFLGQKEFQVVKFARKINSLATTKLTQKYGWQDRDPGGISSAAK